MLSAKFIEKYLNKGGNFLVKNFQGEDTEKLFKFIKIFLTKHNILNQLHQIKNLKKFTS